MTASDESAAEAARENDDGVADAISLDGASYATGDWRELVSQLVDSAPGPAVDPASFRGAMARLASGVVMVTTIVSGRPWGLTVSACCSISVEPPLLLVSLNRRTQSWRAIKTSRSFGVGILAGYQRQLAEFGAAVGSPKFVEDFCDRERESGAPPRLRGAVCHLDCEVYVTQEVGTHGLVIGKVRGVTCEGPADPLIYFDRSFRRLGGPADLTAT